MQGYLVCIRIIAIHCNNNYEGKYEDEVDLFNWMLKCRSLPTVFLSTSFIRMIKCH